MKKFIIIMLCLIGAMTLNTNHAFSRNRKVVATIFADDHTVHWLGDSLIYSHCDSIIRIAAESQDTLLRFCKIDSLGFFPSVITVKKELKKYTYIECYCRVRSGSFFTEDIMSKYDLYCMLYPLHKECNCAMYYEVNYYGREPRKQIEYEIE